MLKNWSPLHSKVSGEHYHILTLPAAAPATDADGDVRCGYSFKFSEFSMFNPTFSPYLELSFVSRVEIKIPKFETENPL